MKYVDEDYDEYNWQPPNPINWDNLIAPAQKFRDFLVALTITFIGVGIWGLAIWKLTELT